MSFTPQLCLDPGRRSMLQFAKKKLLAPLRNSACVQEQRSWVRVSDLQLLRFGRSEELRSRRDPSKFALVFTNPECDIVGSAVRHPPYHGAMVMTARLRPAEIAPTPWPDAASADPIAEVARRLALNLRIAIGEKSLRSVAKGAGLDHSVILRILAGQTWPDIGTVARLELELDADIWPGRTGPIPLA